MGRRNLVLAALASGLACGSALAQEQPAPPLPATSQVEERFSVDGYFRTRGHLWHNLDLNRGPTPTSGEPVFPYAASGAETFSGGDMRLRLDATLSIVSEVKVCARVDGLDNVVLGSTPEGLPASRWAPSIYASTTQNPPEEGVNAFSNSIALKRAWGEALTPIGLFSIGRMGMPLWGLGMLANPGDDIDADFDENVDRVGYATTVFNHLLGVSYDWNASGPTSASQAGERWGQSFDLEPSDNLHTVSLAILRHLDPDATKRRLRADRPAATYGAYATWRRQELDVPSYWLDGVEAQDGSLEEEDLVRRDFRAVGLDLFFKLEAPRFSLALEAAHLGGTVGNLSLLEGVEAAEVSMSQQGAVLRANYSALPENKLLLGVEAGYASGDDAPGLGVAPDPDFATTQAGDLDGPQFSIPGDETIDNFRFSPNYHVDLILWRQLVGAVSDAVYLRPRIASHPHERLDLELAVIHSRAVQASSTPSGEATLGTEFDLELAWRAWHGLLLQAQYGLFLPGAGFRNLQLGLEPEPAHAARLLAAFRF